MIVVVGRVSTDDDKRAALIRAGQAVARSSRAEAGCLNYGLYADTENEHEFVFVEEWETEEALQRHFTTPQIAEFMQAITPTIVAPPEVSFHTIHSSRDLSDVSRG
jgi:quinol monooxygenase YgiN